MNISTLLNSPEKHSYVLGGIFSFCYQSSDKSTFYFLSYNKIQKTNEHIDFKSSYEHYSNFLSRNYDVKNIHDLSLPSDYRISKRNVIGIGIAFQNDLALTPIELMEKIFFSAVKLPNEDKLDLVRGLWDSTGSPDVTANKIARDINWRLGSKAPFFYEALTKDFIINNKININNRINQPDPVSKVKNTQFRNGLTEHMYYIGTRRMPIVSVIEANKFKFKGRNKKCSDISFEYHDGVFSYDFSSYIKFNTRDNDNITKYYKDLEAKTLRSNGFKDIIQIAQMLKDIEIKEEQKQTRRKIPSSIIEDLLKNANFKDEVSGDNLEINGNLIYDVHHVIPHAYGKRLFSQDDIKKIDQKDNLIILSPRTHALLHRGDKSSNIEIFERIYNKVKEREIFIQNKISFEIFLAMY